MSSNNDTETLRALSAGIKLCPPARIFAAASVFASDSTACSADCARMYLNFAGFNEHLGAEGFRDPRAN